LAQAIWVQVLPRSRPVGISPSCSSPSPSLSARPEGQISPRTMSSAVFATLLAASLLQTCACDAQALRALAARKLKASMSPHRRSDARELREEADRRLSMQPSEACLAACPGLQTLQSDILMASTPLWQSSGSPFSLDENGESTAEAAAELVAGIMEITIDAFCAHRPAVQCAVDNPSACSEGSDDILEFAPRLDCLCDACPSATPALAHLAGTFMSSFATAFSGGSGTTTQADISDRRLSGTTEAEPTPSPTPAPCADDDAQIIAVASGLGYNISGCADQVSFCSDGTYGNLLQASCPATCGLCTTVSTTVSTKTETSTTSESTTFSTFTTTASTASVTSETTPTSMSDTSTLTGTSGTTVSTKTAFSGGFGTTTQALGPETTTDISDGGLDDLTGLQMETICAVYPLFSCATDHPAQCGGGILFGGIGDMQDFTTDELALLEETCPSATTTSGTDDSSTTDEESDSSTTGEESDSSTTDEETSNCGFISLGWLSASLPLVVAALRFEAAR